MLVEMFVIGALLYVGWERPFRDWLPSALTGTTKSAGAPVNNAAVPRQPFMTPPASYNTNAPRPAATVSGSWMFDPNHHSALDTPRKGANPPH